MVDFKLSGIRNLDSDFAKHFLKTLQLKYLDSLARIKSLSSPSPDITAIFSVYNSLCDCLTIFFQFDLISYDFCRSLKDYLSRYVDDLIGGDYL